MKYQLLDKRLNDLMMMVLVRQTEECDIMLHKGKSDMLMLVAETEVGDKIVDDVDKLAYAADVMKPRQVDLKRECVQKLRVDLELFQFYIVHVHVIQEQGKSQIKIMKCLSLPIRKLIKFIVEFAFPLLLSQRRALHWHLNPFP
uniref:Uncharacterized protein n=1 Tax=Tanacetum cinerariifolium TaxID=118510 RepID=A0A6L2L8I3_TANCI|nr:hypothetical protein [Tanacetum cinerariifolium]